MSANWNYRQQLIKNADTIIATQQTKECLEHPMFFNKESKQHSSNTPFLYTSCIDNTHPFGYQNSDMKELFLEKTQLKCKMIAPEIHLK
jgi:hypothetical protein